MAKKKSGAQRKRYATIVQAAKYSLICPDLIPKQQERGRPKGETERHRELQNQIHKDLAWLGLPYHPKLFSYLMKNLPSPAWRAEYGLTPLQCPEAYKTINGRHFRREIAFVHQRKVWRGPKSRTLWQHWRHQGYRATRIQD